RENLRAGDRVLEIGGGVGLISLLCAKTCGAENLSIFEPNPAAVAAIKGNFALNGMKPHITEAAMALEDGTTGFFMNDNIFSSSLIDRKNEAKPVAVATRDIRSVIAQEEPTVLVMDIEGAEIDVLPLAAAPSIRAMIVELHPHIVGHQAINDLVETMASKGYPVSVRADEKVVMFESKAA
ncbi:MAG: FkbM family methyltransferase, partial [Rhizobiaceae bacterium]